MTQAIIFNLGLRFPWKRKGGKNTGGNLSLAKKKKVSSSLGKEAHMNLKQEWFEKALEGRYWGCSVASQGT